MCQGSLDLRSLKNVNAAMKPLNTVISCIAVYWRADSAKVEPEILHLSAAPTKESSFGVGASDGCAVCFVGQLRKFSETAEGLRDKLLTSLAADGVRVDAFAAAEEGGPYSIGAFAEHGIKLRKYTWRKHQADAEIEQDFRSKIADKPGALGFYQTLKGSWMSPMFGNFGNAMRFYGLERDCVDMIKEAEREDQKQYTYVVRTRPDLLWTVPHPALSLHSLNRLWVLEGESWLGINGRHMVGDRSMVLTLYDRLRVLEAFDPVVRGMTSKSPNDEGFLEAIAEKHGALLGKIEGFGYLPENPAWATTAWRLKIKIPVYQTEVDRAMHASEKWKQKFVWKRVSEERIQLAQGQL
eukprot:TRINITY_DN31385_c0_g1_i1.p1 TRINITY_DN31385_c0_g1~~TRINITY_DN31385_c0_g1_i1.p1  ORF type:complete len:353 (+),score=39.21 TRINITY_DN31385_c0_g1_i1:3-1061(+)